MYGEVLNDENLYCISTGKILPDNVKEDPIHCMNKGKKGVKNSPMSALHIPIDS